MDEKLKAALVSNETDLDGARKRFVDDAELYLDCLRDFLEDGTMSELKQALAAENWDDAFTAAHAIKGLAGNMGFVPLFHAAAELVVNIRAGRRRDIGPSYLELERCYRQICTAIKENCPDGGNL